MTNSCMAKMRLLPASHHPFPLDTTSNSQSLHQMHEQRSAVPNTSSERATGTAAEEPKQRNKHCVAHPFPRPPALQHTFRWLTHPRLQLAEGPSGPRGRRTRNPRPAPRHRTPCSAGPHRHSGPAAGGRGPPGDENTQHHLIIISTVHQQTHLASPHSQHSPHAIHRNQ